MFFIAGAASAVRWTTLSAIFVALFQVGQLVIISHFLRASDLGLAAIATIVLSFALVVSDIGINYNFIQTDVAPGYRTPLYVLDMGVGVIIWILTWTISP